MKLKKYDPTKLTGNIRRFGEPLNEKVIFPDKYSEDIQKIIHSSKFQKYVYKYDNLMVLTKNLNSLFKKYHIIFYVDFLPKGVDSAVETGFNGAGALSDKYNTIFFTLNSNFKKSTLSDSNFAKMKEGFIKLLNHEIVHRVQKQHINNEKQKVSIYDNAITDSDLKYYSGKYEIMAYAYTIVQDWKLLGNLSDEEILKYLRSRDAQELMKMYRYSYTFQRYTSLFDKNSDVRKLLYKYIVEYIEGE